MANRAVPGPDRMVGILGGMGPLATADFLRELILATPADRDAEHIPVVLSSVPQIPDRVRPIIEGAGPSPLPALCAEIDRLVAAGARCLAMPCNTAHHWIAAMRAHAPVPFLSIIEAAMAAIAARIPAPAAVGLIGTTATLTAGFYQAALAEAGYTCRVPTPDQQAGAVSQGIALVKKGRLADARTLFLEAVGGLEAAGATVTLLACTEVPAALRGDEAWLARHCVDATRALAEACVDWALRR